MWAVQVELSGLFKGREQKCQVGVGRGMDMTGIKTEEKEWICPRCCIIKILLEKEKNLKDKRNSNVVIKSKIAIPSPYICMPL